MFEEIIKIVQGDITKIPTEAIVNAANRTLLGGGGVDGAIHEAAGPELLLECKTLGGCEIGEAKITKGYNLPAQYVIHTVGPVWRDGGNNEKNLLRSCYRNCLGLALKNNIKSIAFPAISTGVYAFPKEKAAKIAVKEVRNFLANDRKIDEIIFVLFTEEDKEIYNSIYQSL